MTAKDPPPEPVDDDDAPSSVPLAVAVTSNHPASHKKRVSETREGSHEPPRVDGKENAFDRRDDDDRHHHHHRDEEQGKGFRTASRDHQVENETTAQSAAVSPKTPPPREEEGARPPPSFVALGLGVWDAVWSPVWSLVDVFPSGVQQGRREGDDNDLPLHAAIRSGAPAEVVRGIVDARPDALLSRDGTGRIPLSYALHEFAEYSGGNRRGRGDGERMIEIARLLVDAAPESLTERDANGNVPLHYAVGCDFEVFEAVAAGGAGGGGRAAVAATNGSRSSPLHAALFFCARAKRRRNVATMRIASHLVMARPDILLGANDGGMIPLHVALRLSLDQRVVWHLYFLSCYAVAGGAGASDVSSCCSCVLEARNTKDGKTALHYAASVKDANSKVFRDMAKESPACLHARDDSGKLPLHLCVTAGRTEVALSLYGEAASLRDSDGNLPLHYARGGRQALLLIDAYPEGLAVANRDGDTPIRNLIRSAVRKQVGLRELDMLLRAVPSFQRHARHRGMSPIFFLLEHSNGPYFRDVLDLLLEDDPECSRKSDRTGANPLHHFAKQRGRSPEESCRIMRLLVDCHPDGICESDRDGNPPLFYAAENHGLDAVYFLVRNIPRERVGELVGRINNSDGR